MGELLLPDGWSSPAWDAPIDEHAVFRAVPKDATVRGLYFENLRRELERRKLPAFDVTRYVAFKMYPMATYAQLVHYTAGLLFPNDPPRLRLRKLGLLAYPAIEQSLSGRVIFGALGRDIMRILKAAAHGYEVSLSHGRCWVVDSGEKFARIYLEDIHVFMDSYHVGVFEGAFLACSEVGEVGVQQISDVSMEIYCAWR